MNGRGGEGNAKKIALVSTVGQWALTKTGKKGNLSAVSSAWGIDRAEANYHTLLEVRDKGRLLFFKCCFLLLSCVTEALEGYKTLCKSLKRNGIGRCETSSAETEREREREATSPLSTCTFSSSSSSSAFQSPPSRHFLLLLLLL